MPSPSPTSRSTTPATDSCRISSQHTTPSSARPRPAASSLSAMARRHHPCNLSRPPVSPMRLGMTHSGPLRGRMPRCRRRNTLFGVGLPSGSNLRRRWPCGRSCRCESSGGTLMFFLWKIGGYLVGWFRLYGCSRWWCEV